ncbi:hypothetical protein R1flu_027637 [Riccia fluitans]|uniref:Uncharacterized protein n=1 Tax=Riccia fluitans TaxID=41844 RepID=A0ABD1XJF0_9MARC
MMASNAAACKKQQILDISSSADIETQHVMKIPIAELSPQAQLLQYVLRKLKLEDDGIRLKVPDGRTFLANQEIIWQMFELTETKVLMGRAASIVNIPKAIATTLTEATLSGMTINWAGAVMDGLYNNIASYTNMGKFHKVHILRKILKHVGAWQEDESVSFVSVVASTPPTILKAFAVVFAQLQLFRKVSPYLQRHHFDSRKRDKTQAHAIQLN